MISSKRDPPSLRSLGPFSIKKKEIVPPDSQIYPGAVAPHLK